MLKQGKYPVKTGKELAEQRKELVKQTRELETMLKDKALRTAIRRMPPGTERDALMQCMQIFGYGPRRAQELKTPKTSRDEFATEKVRQSALAEEIQQRALAKALWDAGRPDLASKAELRARKAREKLDALGAKQRAYDSKIAALRADYLKRKNKRLQEQ